MEASQQLMFALQSPVGLRFGATVQVDADRITFEMDLKIPKGIECSFRMELSGEDDTIMGKVRVERALPARGGNLPRYICKILEMPPEDRARFDGWRRDLATGGVSRRLERDPEQLRAQISTKMMGGATEAESRAVLERMNAKRSSKRKEEGYVEGDPLGLADEQSVPVKPDKSELREKLRDETPVEVPVPSDMEEQEKKLEEAKSARVKELVVPEAESPSWMPPSSDESPQPAAPKAAPPQAAPPKPAAPQAAAPQAAPPKPAAPQAAPPRAAPPKPAAPRAAAPASPPLIVVDSESNPIGLTIIYLSKESFVQDYDATLHTSAVTVDHPNLNQLYHSVRVIFQFADGESITVMGQMVAQIPAGMAIALELDADKREQLRKRAGR